MPGAVKARGPGITRIVGVAALAAALISLFDAAAAESARKSRLDSVSLTRRATVPALPGSSYSAKAACPKRTHALGGGFAVAPTFDPFSNTGTRSMTLHSAPVGFRAWSATGSAFIDPAAAGYFTTYVRCEGPRLGLIINRIFATDVLSPAEGRNLVFNCHEGTHVVAGGFTTEGPDNLADTARGHRTVILQSRRTAPDQWTVSAFNRVDATAPVTLTGFAVCERNGRRQVGEAASISPLVDKGRSSAIAACPKRQHTIAGGFRVSPVVFPGEVPVVAIDENRPLGKRRWLVSSWQHPGYNAPPGSSLEAIAYCKPGR